MFHKDIPVMKVKFNFISNRNRISLWKGNCDYQFLESLPRDGLTFEFINIHIHAYFFIAAHCTYILLILYLAFVFDF